MIGGSVKAAVLAVCVIGLTAAPAQAEDEFGSEGYPATISIEQTSTAQLITKAGTIKCKGSKATGTLAEPSPELTVTPSFSECTLAGIAATVEFKGSFVLSAGLQIKSSVVFKSKECTITVTEQTLSKGMTYGESESGFTITSALTGIAYTTTSGCSGGAGSFSNGEYSDTQKAAGNQGGTWRAQTRLCTQAPTKGVCPKGSGFTKSSVTGISSATVRWETGANTVSCKDSAFNGGFKEDGTASTGGGITSWTFNNGGTPPADCTSDFAGSPKVSVFGENLSYNEAHVSLALLGTRDGTLTFKKTVGTPQIKMIIHLGTGDIACFYEPSARLMAEWSNTGNSTVTFPNQAFSRIDAASSITCPTTFSLEASYAVARNDGDGKIWVGNTVAP